VDVLLVEPALRFERLVMTHQREVWRYLRFLGANPSESDDLTQETFLEVWRRPFVEFSDRASAAYLRRVARNRLLMRLRKQAREPLALDVEQAEAVWVEFAGEDAGDARLGALQACLETLEERSRAALGRLYGGERVPRADVAEGLELSLEGLKTLVRRAKAKLRACVERRLRQEEHEA
jgi:RNA polymerase sigma factor (sigma-70 family)